MSKRHEKPKDYLLVVGLQSLSDQREKKNETPAVWDRQQGRKTVEHQNSESSRKEKLPMIKNMLSDAQGLVIAVHEGKVCR